MLIGYWIVVICYCCWLLVHIYSTMRHLSQANPSTRVNSFPWFQSFAVLWRRRRDYKQTLEFYQQAHAADNKGEVDVTARDGGQCKCKDGGRYSKRPFSSKPLVFINAKLGSICYTCAPEDPLIGGRPNPTKARDAKTPTHLLCSLMILDPLCQLSSVIVSGRVRI